jgi:predicted Zn-dependent peptidase
VHETLRRALPMSVFQPLPPTKDPYRVRLSSTVKEPPEPPAEKLIKRNSTVASPELYVVWSLPRSFDSETVMLDFVNIAANRELSQAFASDPDIVEVGVFAEPGVEASMLVARAVLRKGEHVNQSYERVLDQLVKLWASGEAGREYSEENGAQAVQDQHDFGVLRNSALMGMTMQAESIMSRGVERVQSAHFTGDPLTYSRRLKALGQVSPGQVSHYAEKYLQRARARAVLIEPFAADAKGAGNGPAGLAPAGAETLNVPFPAEAVAQLGRATTERAKNQTVVTAKREQIVETLPNGLKVVIHKRRNSLPLVAMELTFNTGSAGTTPLGAAELGQKVASSHAHQYGRPGDFGISSRVRIGKTRSSYSSEGASGNLVNMLAQMSERVTSMRVDARGLAFFKTEYADYVKQTEELPTEKASRALEAALFPQSPLGETALVSDELKLSGGDVEGWFERAWSPANAVLVVTGDLDAETTLTDVKRWFSDWKPAKDPYPRLTAPTVAPHAATVLVTHQANATQAQVHLACLAPGQSLKAELANRTTASLLATALFDKIRGELGASYGFGGGASSVIGGLQRLDWSGSIENSRLGDALALLSGAVKNFETQTLTDRALERARWETARELTLADSTADSEARVLTSHVFAGRDPEKLDSLFETLAATDRAALLEGWQQCKSTMVISIVGDEAQTREALKKASF